MIDPINILIAVVITALMIYTFRGVIFFGIAAIFGYGLKLYIKLFVKGRKGGW